MNYLPVNVYRSTKFGDSSLNGITSSDEFNLIVPCKEGNLTEEDINTSTTSFVVLQYINMPGAYPRFKPETEGNVRSMFGGNFVWSSDSRFRRQYGDQPIAVFDKFKY